MEINKRTASIVIITHQKVAIQFLPHVKHCAGHGGGWQVSWIYPLQPRLEPPVRLGL